MLTFDDASHLNLIKMTFYNHASNTLLTQRDLGIFEELITKYKRFLGEAIKKDWLYKALRSATVRDNLSVMEIIFKVYPELDVNHSVITDSNSQQGSNDFSTANKTLIILAVECGSVRTLNYLVNQKNAHIYKEYNYFTPLHFACESKNENSLKCVEILTKKMEYVDSERSRSVQENKERWTALLLAARANHTEKVAHLLSKGANPNLVTDHKNVLAYAAYHRNTEMFQLFLKVPHLNYEYLENIKFPELDEVIKIEYTMRKAARQFKSYIFHNSRLGLIGSLETTPLIDKPEDIVRKKEQRAIFDELDHLVYEILNAVINYDGTNENRLKNIQELLRLVNQVYDDCSENLSAQHIQKITENLRLACYKIKLDIENDHFANQHFKHTKSRLATSLDKALPTDNNNRYKEFFVDHEASSSVKEFVALINCIKLPDEWTVFFQNNLVLSEDPNDEIKFYNDDNKVRSLQTLAAEINRLKYKLKNDPDSFNDVLVDLQKQIVLAIKANQTSRFFVSKTAAHLQAFLDVHLAPKINDPEYKSHYGEKHLARPAPSMRINMNEDAGL